ncbi:MAG: 7-carboxy-7-deazaguanine synthase [Pseudomonadota bacterium]
MSYAVKETYLTLQGEGAQTGRAAVFLRFAGCNLWSGREQDRADAVCQFCDTDFVGTDGEGGGRFGSAEALAKHVASFWPGPGRPYVICTGGEPALQIDTALIEALHKEGFEIGIETNGTLPLPTGIDWICVSPKADTKIVITAGSELKLVYPQDGVDPARFADLAFEHFFLQPMDDDRQADHIVATADYCRKNPAWRLSLQTHKLIGIP